MPTVESEKQRRWPAVALVSAVAVAAIGAIAMSLWVHRPKGPGEILRHEFALRILSAAFGREGLRDGFRAPIKIVHRRERRLPALGGIRVTVGGYSFVAPPGAKRIRVIVVAKVHPVRVLAVAYTMPFGGGAPSENHLHPEILHAAAGCHGAIRSTPPIFSTGGCKNNPYLHRAVGDARRLLGDNADRQNVFLEVRMVSGTGATVDTPEGP
jgi:hypothetical protein